MRTHTDTKGCRSIPRQRPRVTLARRPRRGAALLIIVVMLLLVVTAATKAMIENQITDRRSHVDASQAAQLQRALAVADQLTNAEISKLRLPVANSASESENDVWIKFQIESTTGPDAHEILVAILTDDQRELGRGAAPRNETIAGDPNVK